MDTLEWMLWPARWAILLIGLLTQLAALALAMHRKGAQVCSAPASLPVRQTESSPSPAPSLTYDSASDLAPAMDAPAGVRRTESGEYPGTPPPPTASALRIPRGLLLTGGTLVAAFALLERDMLLLAGQVLALPLLWARLR